MMAEKAKAEQALNEEEHELAEGREQEGCCMPIIPLSFKVLRSCAVVFIFYINNLF